VSDTEVAAVSEATPDVLEAMTRLIPQLSASASVPTPEDLARIISSPAVTLLVARTDGVVTGVLTLVIFPVPTRVRAMIEDVVVDERSRGEGIAELLTREALARAKAAGARTVDLTSRPSREAANRLYHRLGFERRETNAYRLSLG
jgi:ribosomal protein S18 acetylase RimI-like enzyme